MPTNYSFKFFIPSCYQETPEGISSTSAIASVPRPGYTAGPCCTCQVHVAWNVQEGGGQCARRNQFICGAGKDHSESKERLRSPSILAFCVSYFFQNTLPACGVLNLRPSCSFPLTGGQIQSPLTNDEHASSPPRSPASDTAATQQQFPVHTSHLCTYDQNMLGLGPPL